MNQSRIHVCLLLIAGLVFGLAAEQARATEPPTLFAEPLSPRIANYFIDVRLDTETGRLEGKELLAWKNPSEDNISEMQFHLYLNALRNEKSTAVTEAEGLMDFVTGGDPEWNGWSGIDIQRVAVQGGPELTSTLRFIQPDDDNTHDKTVVALRLPEPIAPGETIVLEIDFLAKLPSPPLRTGFKEEFFFVGQWFPKVGVYQNGDWNCHQFHANTEFFADFGVYDVRMTVPKENVVGATGVEVEVTDNGDNTRTHYYHAEDVHDFAWTTSPEYVEAKGTVDDVEVRVLLQPDHADQADRHLQAAMGSVAYFQEWIGDYPYPNLTVVDPRRGAQGAGGMEYPTLITAGTFYGIPEGLRMAEMVIVHEFAHNYFYHLLATNEFEEAWLDEGFTTYAEMRIMKHLYGDDANMVDLFGLQMSDLQQTRASYLSQPDVESTARPGWKYYTRSSYAVNSYSKSGLMLLTLEHYLGDETMTRILRAYYDRWRFKHPTTEDFIQIAEAVSGKELRWFFDQWLYTNATLDYDLRVIECSQISPPKGYDFTLIPFETEPKTEDDEGNEKVTDTADAGDSGPSASGGKAEGEGEDERYKCDVYIRRHGDFTFPVEIEIKYDDGETERVHWDGKDYWKKLTFEGTREVVQATIDPDNKVPIDINTTNNSEAAKKEGTGVAKLGFTSLFLTQTVLEQPELMNLFSAFAGVME